MVSQGSLSLVAAVTGLIAAIAGLVSAGIAKSAAKHAQHVERRSLLRDLTAAANSVIAVSLQIDGTSRELELAYRDSFSLAGRSGGEKHLVEEMKRKQRRVDELGEEARKLLDNYESLNDYDVDYLISLVTRFEGYEYQVLRVKEDLSQKLTSTKQDIRERRPGSKSA